MDHIPYHFPMGVPSPGHLRYRQASKYNLSNTSVCLFQEFINLSLSERLAHLPIKRGSLLHQDLGIDDSSTSVDDVEDVPAQQHTRPTPLKNSKTMIGYSEICVFSKGGFK